MNLTRMVSPLLLGFTTLAPAFASSYQDGARTSVDELLAALQAEYGTKESKYASLTKKVARAVNEALAKTTWEDGEGKASPLTEHPLALRIADLAEAGREASGVRRNPAEVAALLAKYPWSEQLELASGLRQGSDRQVPTHDQGFIQLGAPEGPLPGFPDLYVNQYLFGFGEIVSGRSRVKDRRGLSFEGRGSKDRAEAESKLPAWEALRVYLHGSVPEVPLFALPQLQHEIHRRLVERRRGPDGGRAPMDEVLALLDSRWNGFSYVPPWSKTPHAIVQPVHALYTDRLGFVFRFPDSKGLQQSGDLPFLSIFTHQLYGQSILGTELPTQDYIRKTDEARVVLERLDADSVYLARYRMLVDVLARTLILPDARFPRYLSILDYPAGATASERTIDGRLDVPRRYFLLLWAFCEFDPEKLADYVHENLLSKETNTFGGQNHLPYELVNHLREVEGKLLASIARRAVSGVDRRELSPYASWDDPSTAPEAAYLLHSFQTFHEPVGRAIRESAYAVVREELGE